jgi:hypothetical protein
VGAGSRKGVGRMGEWPRNARSGRAHNRERRWEVREGEVADRWGPRVSEGAYANGRSVLTERSHRVEREGTSTCVKGSTPIGWSHRAAGGLEGERARTRSSLRGGTHLLGDAGTRVAWLGWIGPNGLKLVFLFPEIFKMLFFLFSLWISNQIQTKFKFKQFQTCTSNKRIIYAHHDATFHDSHKL